MQQDELVPVGGDTGMSRVLQKASAEGLQPGNAEITRLFHSSVPGRSSLGHKGRRGNQALFSLSRTTPHPESIPQPRAVLARRSRRGCRKGWNSIRRLTVDQICAGLLKTSRTVRSRTSRLMGFLRKGIPSLRTCMTLSS